MQKSSPIQYKLTHHISPISQSAYLLIQFSNPFLTRSIKLQSLPSFPKSRICQYQYEYHPNYIKIVSITPSTATQSTLQQMVPQPSSSIAFSQSSDDISEQLAIFMQELDKILGNIRETIVHNSKIVKLSCEDVLMDMLDFSQVCGFRIIKNNNHNINQTKSYKIGDILIFYQSNPNNSNNLNKQSKLNQLFSQIKSFNDQLVYYPLQPLITKYSLSNNSVNQLRNIFNQMINCYSSQIQATAAYYQFYIGYMNVCVERVTEFDGVDSGDGENGRKRHGNYGQGQDQVQSSRILPQNVSDLNYFNQQQKPSQLFLGLYIIGPIPNIHEFYLALQHTLNTIKLQYIPFQQIRTTKLHQIATIKQLNYNNCNRMVDHQHLLVMNRYIGFGMEGDRGAMDQEQERSQGVLWTEVDIGSFLFFDGQCVNFNGIDGEIGILDENQREIINLELKYYRFKQYMNKNKAEFLKLQFPQSNTRTLLIKCKHKNLSHIIKTIKKYCKTMARQTKQCNELPLHDPLLINTFMKHYRPEMQQQFSIKFHFDVNTNLLYRTNFTQDTQKIVYELECYREELLRSVLVVPSLVQIGEYQAKLGDIENMYRVLKRPEGYWNCFWRSIRYQLIMSNANSNTNSNSNNNSNIKNMIANNNQNHITYGPHITVTNLSNLTTYKQQIILILHNQIPHNSQIYAIAKQNDINLSNFIYGPHHNRFQETNNNINYKNNNNNNNNNNNIKDNDNTKQTSSTTSRSRVRKYQTKYSKKYNNITILYLDIKKCNPRYIDQDIRNCLYSVQNKQEINLIVGQNSKKFYQEIFNKFVSVYAEIMIKQDRQENRNGGYGGNREIKQLKIYCENNGDISTVQSYLLNLNLNLNLNSNSNIFNFNANSNKNTATNIKIQSKLIAHDELNQWSILRINNLKQYILSYYWNSKTYTLPGLDSYIFSHQKNKSSKRRALLTIPTLKELEEGYRQLYIDFRMGRLFLVRSFSLVLSVGIEEMSKKFQRFYRLVKKQFSQIDHFVAYIKNTVPPQTLNTPIINQDKNNNIPHPSSATNTNQLTQQICMNIYYSNQSSNKQIFPLLLDLNCMKVTIDANKQKIMYAVTEKKYIDWFGIEICQRERQNLQKCLDK